MEAALSQTEEIRNELAQIEEKATLEAFGIYVQEEDSEDSESKDDDSEQDVHVYWSSDESESNHEEVSTFKGKCSAVISSEKDRTCQTSINAECHID